MFCNAGQSAEASLFKHYSSILEVIPYNTGHCVLSDMPACLSEVEDISGRQEIDDYIDDLRGKRKQGRHKILTRKG
jgi:hypothetical protein